MTNFDKSEWQAEQAERDRIEQSERDRLARVKARAARRAQRKIARLKSKLEASGTLTDWESEFSESVGERLETFGSAFQDHQKGRPGDALSFAQKRVVAALSKKAKSSQPDKDGSAKPRPKSSFKASSGFRNKSKFTPRVRHLEDDLRETHPDEPFLPEYTPEERPKKPFLRIVK